MHAHAIQLIVWCSHYYPVNSTEPSSRLVANPISIKHVSANSRNRAMRNFRCIWCSRSGALSISNNRAWSLGSRRAAMRSLFFFSLACYSSVTTMRFGLYVSVSTPARSNRGADSSSLSISTPKMLWLPFFCARCSVPTKGAAFFLLSAKKRS